MAQKINGSTRNTAKAPAFSRDSKMKKYNIIYDEDVKQMRTGFFASYSGTTLNDDDTIWSVEPGFEYRTDLISNKFYGTSRYDWIIERINDIKDPVKDVTVGLKLRILSQSRILSLI